MYAHTHYKYAHTSADTCLVEFYLFYSFGFIMAISIEHIHVKVIETGGAKYHHLKKMAGRLLNL